VTAPVAVAIAAALVLGGVIDPLVLLPAVLLTQVLLAVAWFPALQAASPIGGRIVVLAAAGAADVAVLAADETRPMEHVAPVLAIAMLAALAHQLVRRDGRGGLTASLTATGSATVFACLGSAWLALDVSREGTGLLVLGAVAAAAPAVVDLAGSRLGRPSWAGAVWAAAVTGAAAAVVAETTDVSLPVALAAGAGAVVAARLGVLLADRAPVPHPLLPAALPPVLVAPVVYLLGRLLIG
jgi:hypothetical protein